MTLGPVLDVLSRRLGLDPGSLGPASLSAAIGAAMHAAGYGDPAAYAGLVREDETAFTALVEEVVVAETWFFRGGELFAHLAEQVRAARRGRPFRALSLPSSTGEEAYSLALAVRDAGLDPVVIDGVDVSPRALGEARAAVFGELSFRQTDPAVRERHFRPVAGGWELLPDRRDGVRFHLGNLVDPGLFILQRPYDLVFCRNVFIYLTPEARRVALSNLARLTRAGGLLCTGPAEPLPPRDDRFERAGPPAFCLYRRTGEKPPSSFEMPAVVAAPPPRRDPPPDARRLADAGRLDEALVACEAMAESAERFALLGLIHQARHDDARAVRSFRQALYLDPSHREAITHLMLHHQRANEPALAAGLRRRLDRLGEER